MADPMREPELAAMVAMEAIIETLIDAGIPQPLFEAVLTKKIAGLAEHPYARQLLTGLREMTRLRDGTRSLAAKEPKGAA